MRFVPDLLTQHDGHPVVTPQDWAARRKEILDILSREIYGFSPPVLAPTTGRVISQKSKCASGHAILERVEITAATQKGQYTFPMNFFFPTAPGKHPLFVLVNFRPDAYDMYYPLEELIDRGYALAVLYYQDITTDDADFTNGLAAHFPRPQDGTGFGKISLWAWAASRALDYLLTRPEIDPARTAVIGHSRLGKTALWCAAQDERFRFGFSNDSGCAGAALEKIKHEGAETTAFITQRFPYWFCENYFRYAEKPEAMPFDQHFLVAAIAPRFVGIGSATKDLWADPVSEQLCCLAASPAWEALGLKGYVGPQTPAKAGEHFGEGHVGYHLRDGIHFLGRGDWLAYMDFMDCHRE